MSILNLAYFDLICKYFKLLFFKFQWIEWLLFLKVYPKSKMQTVEIEVQNSDYEIVDDFLGPKEGQVCLRGVIYEQWIKNQKKSCLKCGTLAKTHNCKQEYFAEEAKNGQRRFKICLFCNTILDKNKHKCIQTGRVLNKMIVQTRNKKVINDLKEVGMINSSKNVMSDVPYLIGMWEIICKIRKGNNQDAQLMNKIKQIKRKKGFEIFDEKKLRQNLFLPETYFDICKLAGCIAAVKIKKKKISIQDLLKFQWQGFQDFNISIMDIFSSMGQISELVWHLKRQHFKKFLANKHLFLRGDFRNDARYLSEEEEQEMMKLKQIFDTNQGQIVSIQDCVLQKIIKTQFLFKFFIAETMYTVVDLKQCSKIYNSFENNDWIYEFGENEQKQIANIALSNQRNTLDSQDYGNMMADRKEFLGLIKQKYDFWKQRVRTWKIFNSNAKEKNRYQFKHPNHVYDYLRRYHQFKQKQLQQKEQIEKKMKERSELKDLLCTFNKYRGDKNQALKQIHSKYEFKQQQLRFLAETCNNSYEERSLQSMSQRKSMKHIDVAQIYSDLCKKSKRIQTPNLVEFDDFFQIPMAKYSEYIFDQQFVPYQVFQIQSWAGRGCNQAFPITAWFLKKVSIQKMTSYLQKIYQGFVDNQIHEKNIEKNKKIHERLLSFQNRWWLKIGLTIKQKITRQWKMIDYIKDTIQSKQERFADAWERKNRKILFEMFKEKYQQYQKDYIEPEVIDKHNIEQQFQIDFVNRNKIKTLNATSKSKFNYYKLKPKYFKEKENKIRQNLRQQFIIEKLNPNDQCLIQFLQKETKINYLESAYSDEQIIKIIKKLQKDLSVLLYFLTERQLRRHAATVKGLFHSNFQLMKAIQKSDQRLSKILFTEQQQIQMFRSVYFQYGKSLRMLYSTILEHKIKGQYPICKLKKFIILNFHYMIEVKINHYYQQLWSRSLQQLEYRGMYFAKQMAVAQYNQLLKKIDICFNQNQDQRFQYFIQLMNVAWPINRSYIYNPEIHHNVPRFYIPEPRYEINYPQSNYDVKTRPIYLIIPPSHPQSLKPSKKPVKQVEEILIQPVKQIEIQQSIQPVQQIQPVQEIQQIQPAQEIQEIQQIQPVQEIQQIQPVQEIQQIQPIQEIQQIQPIQEIHQIQPAQQIQQIQQQIKQIQRIQQVQEVQEIKQVNLIQVLNQYQDRIKQKQQQWKFDLQQIELKSKKRSSPINSQIKIKTKNLIFNLSTKEFINCPKKWDCEQFNIASLLKILTFVTTRRLLSGLQISPVYPQIFKSPLASKADLLPNKTYSLQSLFKGLIILSGCDAAITLQKIIANILSKSLKQQMQKYSDEKKWKFNVRDTSGFGSSTATQKCVLQLFIQALKDPLFSELIRQKSWNGKLNTNQLIDSGIYGKTGNWGKHNFIGYKKICQQQLIILSTDKQPEQTWLSISNDMQTLKQQILKASDIQLINMNRPDKCSCGKKFNYKINSCTKCEIKLEKKVPEKKYSIGYYRQCQDIQINGGFKLANFIGENNLKNRIQQRYPRSRISQSLVYTGKLAGQIFVVDIPRVSDADSQVINTTLENWEKLPLQIFTINATIGQGIIATEQIDKDVCLGSYTGQVYSIQQLPSDNNSIVDLGFIKNSAFMVCPEKVLNYGRYFNGVINQKPNLSVNRTLFKNRKGQLEFGLICKTLKKIKKGEEIKWKYGANYWGNI